MIKFKIIIPFYNVEKWIKSNIESILKQTYKNYECFYVDDFSTDNTCKIIESFKNDKFNLIKNVEKKCSLENIYNGIKISQADDEDVIIILDGDDWLYTHKALEILNKAYLKYDILLTYGNYISYPNGEIPNNVKMYDEYIIKNNLFRQDQWRASHLKTFKYKLWKNLNYNDLKDSSGHFYKMTGDLAIMFPMLEMAGEKIKCIEDILCVYNISNPINDDKVDRALQIRLEQEIRNKNKYRRIYDIKE